jgi:Flp pilus assembly protein TadD
VPSVAVLWLAASVAAAPSPTPGALARAEGLLGRKDYAGAEVLLREILRSEPSNARAQGNLALALLSQRKTREAVDAGRLAAAYAPKSAEARYIYGVALRAAGQSADAAREFRQAVELRPDAIGPLDALAEAYAATGDERAAAVYERLIVLEPAGRGHRMGLAEHLWSLGKNEQGNEAAARAVRDFPDYAELYAVYGRALFDQQRFADAAAQLSRAQRLGVTDAETLRLRANALSLAGRADEAKTAFQEAVLQHPDSGALHLDLGRLYLSLAEAEPARRELEEAARLAPGDATTQFQLGRAFEATGQLAEAETAYRKAVALAPQLASPHYALGRLLVREGQREEGQKELEVYRVIYERAARIQYETESRRGEILLAEAELARGESAAALKRFESLPEGVDVLTGRAKALSYLNRHREAVRVLERARDLQPDDPRIQVFLATERARSQEKP